MTDILMKLCYYKMFVLNGIIIPKDPLFEEPISLVALKIILK